MLGDLLAPDRTRARDRTTRREADMTDQSADYRGYFLDTYQIGMDWHVRITAGSKSWQIGAPFNVGAGRTREEARRAAEALVDEFLDRRTPGGAVQ
jgi:hypothetical protein